MTFCGYSIPHPAEPIVNVRLQTSGTQRGLESCVPPICASYLPAAAQVLPPPMSCALD